MNATEKQGLLSAVFMFENMTVIHELGEHDGFIERNENRDRPVHGYFHVVPVADEGLRLAIDGNHLEVSLVDVELVQLCRRVDQQPFFSVTQPYSGVDPIEIEQFVVDGEGVRVIIVCKRKAAILGNGHVTQIGIFRKGACECERCGGWPCFHRDSAR